MDVSAIRERWKPEPGSRLDELLVAYTDAREIVLDEVQRRQELGTVTGPVLQGTEGIRSFRARRALQEALEQLEAPQNRLAQIRRDIGKQEELLAEKRRQNEDEAARVAQLRETGRRGVLTRFVDTRGVEETLERLRQDLSAWKRADTVRRQWWCKAEFWRDDGHGTNQD